MVAKEGRGLIESEDDTIPRIHVTSGEKVIECSITTRPRPVPLLIPHGNLETVFTTCTFIVEGELSMSQ